MKLFVISDAAVQTAFQAKLTAMFAANPTILRIDGVRDEPDGSWFNYSFGKTPVFSGLDWLQNFDTLTGSGTMIIENIAYPLLKYIPTWKVDGIDPATVWPFVCEYI
jgi:hypothetical protein